MSRWMPLLLGLGLAGCAAAPGPREAAGPGDDHGAGGAAVGRQGDDDAVARLWDRAERARRAGRPDDAAAALERALERAPGDAVLWSRLAEVRLQQADYAGAEDLAARSNALAGEERRLRHRNWLLIGEARARRGDAVGARAARARADALHGS